ncbi:protein of unknown function [Methylocaldum szegediense]|uniref:Uncharacterized protein n=1 Tax=Methylocaldum szegediense TaxID=73780 RepID=A0ABM9I4M4_9GAMM|nr:protein of unknown function [Methylocaldum szegediense]
MLCLTRPMQAWNVYYPTESAVTQLSKIPYAKKPLEITRLSQLFRHDAVYGDVNPLLVSPRKMLVAFAGPSGMVQPGEHVVHHPRKRDRRTNFRLPWDRTQRSDRI